LQEAEKAIRSVSQTRWLSVFRCAAHLENLKAQSKVSGPRVVVGVINNDFAGSQTERSNTDQVGFMLLSLRKADSFDRL
jgi:hypothetical protein